jgi:glycosyltransferase involved in cell wall biosynthesis
MKLSQISIILPTLNERAALEKHVAALVPVLGEAREVLVIDSDSDDGTLPFLKESLAGCNARFFNRPRGLYAAWNFGVREAVGEAIYFSTAGDLLLPGGLESLSDRMQQTRADVVISPPQMSGAPPIPQWPIHHLVQMGLPQEGRTLTIGEKCAMNFGFTMGRGLLGSSASNLYRRQFLSEHAFPEDSGHGGDTIWAARFAKDAHVFAIPQPVAQFAYEARNHGYFSPDETAVYPRVMEELERLVGGLRAFEENALDIAERLFLAGRVEVNTCYLADRATQAQQLSYIGELQVELEKRSELIMRLDEECRELSQQLYAPPPPRPKRGPIQQLAGRLLGI